MAIDISPLLVPISAEAPSGTDIRYHPVTEKIKETRRQEDDISQGVWKHEVKAANFPLALKLCSEVLTKQSKDLQVAAWMTEALANLDGLAGLRQGLELVRGLLDNFWDSVYPQIEDGDLDLRSMPLSWLGSQLSSSVRYAPLLKGGYHWHNYRSSRSIPTEEQAQNDPEKLNARNEALQEGEVSPEDLDKAFESTSFSELKATYEELTTLHAHVESLSEFCNEKFSDQSPDFGPLRAALEEVGGTARVLFKKKEALEPPGDEGTEAPTLDQQLEPEVYQTPESAQENIATPAPRRGMSSTTADPASVEDAIERILDSARYVRRQDPQSPVSYLITRALRWGEFRGAQGSQEISAAPPSQVRMELKRLAAEGSWEALRDASEEAVAEPCGRAWLDLQRYAVQACRYSGCYAAANAILSELRALISEFPELPKSMLADDTPTAGPETLQWLTDENVIAQAAPVLATPREEWRFTPETAPLSEPSPASLPETPDPYDLAVEAARSGRLEEAVEILSAEVAQENSGRARFLRRIQLAQVCLAAGHDAIGRPVLRDLSDEISRRSLENWETPEVISQPLALLYRCLDVDAPKEKEELYARICKLDPLQALRLVK